VIERLTADTVGTAEHLGGKAIGLVRLLSAGLKVPEAWVIPAWVSLDPAARGRCADELCPWWAGVNAEFGDSRWAVRSSAVAEDLEGASFAGVYETVLGIGTLSELVQAVHECWAAHEAKRADVYRGERGLDARGGIALVVQRMVASQVAGVMLTSNPQRPFADEIVIDAAWGLGEAIVSGKVDPDHYVLQRSTGTLRSSRVATKCVETTCDDGVLADREVETRRRNLPTLDDAGLDALYAVARRIGSRIGQARDIEWAMEDGSVYALQDRPITALPSAAPGNVWSRKWGDEYKSEYSLPLPTALFAAWMDIPLFVELAHLQHRRDLAGRVPYKLYNGYTYMDGQYMARYARAFPKGLRASVFGNWFTPLWMQRIEAEPWSPRYTAGMAVAPLRDPRRGPVQVNLDAMRRHCAQIEAAVLPKLHQDYRRLDLREWRRQLDEVDGLGREHFRIIRWGMGVHNNLLHGALSALLAKYAGDDDGRLYYTMISGLPGTRTAQINAAVWDLAVKARADDGLTQALRAGREYRDMRTEFADSLFWPAFDTFLAEHGHRSASRDIAAPRWSEQPDIILGFVRAQLHSIEPPESPRSCEQRAAAQREQATDEALRRMRRGPLGRLRAGLLARIYARTQQFTVYRENQRYHLDYLLTHLRSLILEQARRLVERGLLDDSDDVFLLTGAEFWAAVAGATDAIDRDAVQRRREHFLTYRDRIPATYLFDDVETEGEISEGDSADVGDNDGIRGVGASRGVARGRTRCVSELAQLAEVQPGDVLVARNIDPGWTSVFPLLAGLVTETGGVLSHGAILAREYGVPTVTGVARAMELLPSGTLVELDGGSGTVVPEVELIPATP
jgi:phosphohistidine swiveling domain-containing protein